jgi:hypothetical protein
MLFEQYLKHLTKAFLVIHHKYPLSVCHSFPSARSVMAGSHTVNVLPLAFSLSTVILPPKASIIRAEMASPSPVPCPGSLVVKNGSNMRSRFLCQYQHQVSPISILTNLALSRRDVNEGSAEVVFPPPHPDAR